MSDAVAFWEDFYGGGRSRWSGRANELLVAEVASLPAGTALDLGCGQGGDALWLAAHGWQVTAVDVSAAALAFAAEQAAIAGVGEAIRWERHDLDETFPDGEFDLVASCYLQSPVALGRTAILQAAAAAVRPGGTLVVVGHAGSPSWTPPGHHVPHMPDAAEVLASLELDAAWDVERCDEVDVATRDPDGAPATRPDSVVRARRLHR